jgi:hypothetical protein
LWLIPLIVLLAALLAGLLIGLRRRRSQ